MYKCARWFCYSSHLSFLPVCSVFASLQCRGGGIDVVTSPRLMVPPSGAKERMIALPLKKQQNQMTRHSSAGWRVYVVRSGTALGHP